MYKNRIDAYIDDMKELMLEDLKMLVRINSQKGKAEAGMPFGKGPAEAIAAAEALMQKYGLKTTNYDNYVVTGDFSDKEKALDVLAHLDVVPVTDDWTVTQPFEPKVVDGKIYGRGTADDKGPAIAALYAIRAIKELNIPMKKSVRLILGSDEECGSSDLRYYYSVEEEAPFTFTPDADFPLINIEKGRLEGCFRKAFPEKTQYPCVLRIVSGDKINVVPQKAYAIVAGMDLDVLKEKAEELSRNLAVTCTVREINAQEAEVEVPDDISVFRIDLKGKAAHASTPQEGKNALTAMLRFLSGLPLFENEMTNAIRALDEILPYEDTCGKAAGIQREDPESGALTLCFSMLTADSKEMVGYFDTRLPIECNEENTKTPLEELFKQKNFEYKTQKMVSPHCVPGDSDFVKTLLDSYERYTGIKGKPLSTGGGTYVHNLKRGVAFGCMVPEVDNHMHGDDEFMVIDQLLLSAKIFADAIIKICN